MVEMIAYLIQGELRSMPRTIRRRRIGSGVKQPKADGSAQARE